MMKTYKLWRIFSSGGEDFGVYRGETARAAWEAMVEDGGRALDCDGKPTEGCFEDWRVVEETGWKFEVIH